MTRSATAGGLDHHRGAGLALALFGAVLLVSGVVAAPASAATDPTDDDLWYYSVLEVAAAHQTTTGKGVTIAVLDSPVNPGAPDLVGTKLITHPDALCATDDGTRLAGVSTDQAAEHATAMVGLIIGTGAGTGGQPGVRGVAPDATVRHYANLLGDGGECRSNGISGLSIAINQAVTDGAQIISISQGGGADPDLLGAIARAERAGVIIVAAADQQGGTELGWPATANGVVSVGSDDVNQQLEPRAVTSPLLAVVAPGQAIRTLSWADGRWDTYLPRDGTSNATALTAGMLALVWSAHPDASANQVIQTLLRNTGTGGGELARNDSWGYGPVSLANMLTVDPTTYPDVNPLLRASPDAEPPYADIAGAGTWAPTRPTTAAHPRPSGVPDARATADAADDPVPWPLVAGASLLGSAIIAGGMAAVLAARRRRNTPVPGPSSH